ncbi:MAG TPA: ATP-binding cassette domain-containing protein, partial [Candidatus Latescibacteria bacterium]|nr:ATP-binding cassette domain-containing protein [Candidatus Latescibacterota bacterium]
MSLLRIERVEKSFGGVRALRGVSFEVERYQIKALIGPNGAGKTTLFHVVTGVEKPDSGEVYFKGERIDRRRPDQVVRMGISRTFQNVRPFAGMTVLENVMAGRHRLT